MGRAEKQTKQKSVQKKPVNISTDAKREKWLEKSDKRRNKVEWVTLTGSLDLVAIDPELLLDQDGDRVYRQVYFVTKDGLPTEKWGFAKTYDNTFLHERFIGRIPQDVQKKIHKWFETRTEDVQYTDERTGMVFGRLEIKPLKVNVPGWERLTKKEYKKHREESIQSTAALFSRMFAAGI